MLFKIKITINDSPTVLEKANLVGAIFKTGMGNFIKITKVLQVDGRCDISYVYYSTDEDKITSDIREILWKDLYNHWRTGTIKIINPEWAPQKLKDFR